MRHKERIEKIKSLKSEGFKVVKDHPDLYISPDGRLYNLERKWEYTIRSKPNILVCGQLLNVPKLVLQTFANQPYRTHQHITFLDGNRSNMNIANLKYSNVIPSKQVNVDGERLLMAIRCYINVSKRYNVKDIFRTKTYLLSIVKTRSFISSHFEDMYIGIFSEYLEKTTAIRKDIAEKHVITIFDCHNIINGFINQLVDEILQDLDTGLLEIKDFRKRTRKPASKLTYREFKKFLAELRQEKSI